jgi:NADP-dependent 3-hydroxy acid dehydrogenase YdfG
MIEDLNSFWRERLSGKRVVITGGSTGIGREIAFLLTALGARCLICGRHREQLDETAAEIEKRSPWAYCEGVIADLSRQEDIERLFQVADVKLGGVDILVNNAALAFGSVSEGSYPDWNYVVQTNLLAYMACSQEAVKRMSEAGNGHILCIGSMSADVREEGSSVYVATKAGIQGFCGALRKELNPKGIKVSLVEPGAADTDLQDGSAEEKLSQVSNKEMLKAEDVAMSAAFCLVQPDRCDIVSVQVRPHLQLI